MECPDIGAHLPLRSPPQGPPETVQQPWRTWFSSAEELLSRRVAENLSYSMLNQMFAPLKGSPCEDNASQATADTCSRNLSTVLEPEAETLAMHEAAEEVDFMGRIIYFLAPQFTIFGEWPLFVNISSC